MNFFHNKKILVLGGTGHLGSALIHTLINEHQSSSKDIRVFYLNNTPTDSLQDISGLDMFPGNVLKFEEVKSACEGVDLVFDHIGLTTFDPTQRRIQWKINVEGTRNLLEAVRATPQIQKVVYTSTVNVLGVPQPRGSLGNFDTADPYTSKPRVHSFASSAEALDFIQYVKNNPDAKWEKKINIGYLDSKLAAQELVLQYVKDYNLNVVSILPGTMFGPFDQFVGSGIYLLTLYRGQMPGVMNTGFPLAHVLDVAEGHLLAMEKAQKGSRYIMTGKAEDNRTLKDMASIIVDVLREQFPNRTFKKPSVVFPHWVALIGAYFSDWYASLAHKPSLLTVPSVKAGSYKSFYTYANAEKDLGYTPKRSFRQAVEEMCQYYQKFQIFEKAKGRYIDQKK